MKKFMKKTFVLLLALGMLFSQSNMAVASQTSDGYLTASKPITSRINLKLRASSNFFYKGNIDLQFVTSGEYVTFKGFNNIDKNWAWDDDYTVTVHNRGLRQVVNTKFRAGGNVSDDLVNFSNTFNWLKKIKVGYTLTISSYWDDTIKPKNGAKNHLYLGYPPIRKRYSFVFTNEGLVESADNLKGTSNANTSYIGLPVKSSAFPHVIFYESYPLDFFPVYRNEKLHVTIDKAGNVSFKANPIASYVKMATTVKVQAKRGYLVEWYNSYSNDSFKNIVNFLNVRKLKLGDTISFYFDRNAITPRLGRNLRKYSDGYYDFQTTGETKLKLTRYGFLTSDGFLVKYTATV